MEGRVRTGKPKITIPMFIANAHFLFLLFSSSLLIITLLHVPIYLTCSCCLFLVSLFTVLINAVTYCFSKNGLLTTKILKSVFGTTLVKRRNYQKKLFDVFWIISPFLMLKYDIFILNTYACILNSALIFLVL